MFVHKDGSPIHPGYASGRFRLLVATTDVPPIRLHDLRHSATSLAHEAGADLKTLQVLRADENPAELRPLVTEVLHIADAHPNDTLLSRIRRGP